MSYILDALRKSEKERKRGTPPDLLATQETVFQEQRKRSPWPYIISFVLLINMVVIIYWFASSEKKIKVMTGQTGQETAASEREVLNDPGSLSQMGDHVVAAGNKLSTAKPDYGRNEHIMANGTRESVPKADKKGNEGYPAPGSLSKGDAIAGKEHTQNPGPEDSMKELKNDSIVNPDKSKIYALNELPHSIRQKLSDFNITVFLYSDDPAARMIRINSQTLKEGQYMESGPKVEQIIPNGALFSYQSFRFLVELK